MRLSAGTLTAIAVVVVVGLGSAAAGQTSEGRVHGVVADESGGVLPGVTVAAIGADGKALATKVTNEVGRYGFALPAVPVSLTFSLEGFSTAAVNLEIPPDADVPVAAQRLALAPRSETVTVHGDSLAEGPAAPRPPPPPVAIPLPEHDHDSICGPAKAAGTLESLGTIRMHSNRGEQDSALFAQDDQIV